jgi:transposase-like protein
MGCRFPSLDTPTSLQAVAGSKLNILMRKLFNEDIVMAEVTCPRCGSKDAALVRKEVFGAGKFNRRKWRCPRCNHIWETVTDSSGKPVKASE